MAPVHPMPTQNRFQDLTGQSFGRLTVESYAGRGKRGKATLWLCKCSCGESTIVQASNLKSGSIRSCGCLYRKDLKGQRFGRLLVVAFAWSDEGKTHWLCRCDCGRGAVVLTNSLTAGKTKSCGCWRAEEASRRQFEDLTGRKFGRLRVVSCAGQAKKCDNYRWECHCDCGEVVIVKAANLKNRYSRSCGCSQRKHMATNTPEYQAWQGMKNRCHNPNDASFSRYGGRGIKVCDQWRNDFKAFLRNVGPRPSRQHSLDRINNDGNYEPGNVRWALADRQARNRSNNVLVTHDGETLTAVEWAERLGIPASTFRKRLEKGWTHERAVTTPLQHHQPPSHYRGQPTRGAARTAALLQTSEMQAEPPTPTMPSPPEHQPPLPFPGWLE